jgi:isopentenyl diphosphate isomerase/L-lactate dehydrogenase-like FMN-dependent dehydrogenase
MPQPPEMVTIEDYERIARERLPSDTWEYYSGGAGDEWTLAENRRAFDRWVIRPRMLVTKRERDLSTAILGQDVSMPVLIAPWAYQRLAHAEGEIATARAAARAGTIMAVSTTAVAHAEAIADASSAPKWWQLYVFADRGATAEMLRRVASVGYGAIVITTDFQEGGLRYGLMRSGWDPPIEMGYTDLAFDPAISWDDIAWVREQTGGLPVILKGILTAEDARLAADAGVDAVVVSNHGGRQLDHAPASITVLPEIVEAVDGRLPVLLDSGVRHGGDVFVALALGAAAVFVGRPIAWGLAARGEEGVFEVLEILRAELDNVMALSGCNRIADITRAHVARAE